MGAISNIRLISAGLAGGAALNLVDTPWSVVVMVPAMQTFLNEHQLTSSALTGPWFLLVHFAFMFLIAWVYSIARGSYKPGLVLAMLIGGAFLVVNRAFGLGNVLIGLLPLQVFLGFSISFALGTLLGSFVAAKVIDHRTA